MTGLFGWMLAFAAAGPVRAADPDPNDDSASMERAVAMIKEGADGHEIVALLEPLGYKGNARAQLMLGVLHLDGKSMPRNVVQGHAWLEIAATTPDPTIARQAQDMLLANAAALSGSELIRAEQRAAAIRSEMAERSYQRYAAGLRHFTTERPVSFFPWIKFGAEVVQLTTPAASLSDPDFQLGCAATAARRCLAKSQRVEGPRCTGRIVQVDSGPNAAPSRDTHVVAPDMPTELRRRGFRATAQVVVHVDGSGWVCGAAIAASSGAPLWDATALTTVTRWRLNPAMRGGEAVEGLYIVSLSGRSM
ncbi:MAG: TonB family protein [Steroidobacteraceae bacterium]